MLLTISFPLKTDKEFFFFFFKTDSVDKKAESNQRPNPDMLGLFWFQIQISQICWFIKFTGQQE